MTHTYGGAFSSRVLLRATSTLGSDIFSDVTFLVRVCGEEYVNTIVDKYLELFFWEPGDPAAMPASRRYATIPQSTFASWFAVEPAGDPCIVKDYALDGYWYKDYNADWRVFPQWKPSNPNVTWHGTMGSYELKIDKTAKGAWTILYLLAETRGMVKAARKLTAVVCARDCFRKSSSYRDNLEYVVPKDAVRLGLTDWLVRPKSDWFHMVEFIDCPYCASLVSHRLVTVTPTFGGGEIVKAYTDGMVSLDAAGNLHLGQG